MSVRIKSRGPYRYLQIVENHREGKRTVQRVLCTLGRADDVITSGGTDTLIRSMSRYAKQVRVVDGYRSGHLEAGAARQLGPDLVFGRLWDETGIGQVLSELLEGRRFKFDVERSVYLTVLHRLFESGSDRVAERWRRDVRIPGAEELELHHLYRAMRWLGEEQGEGGGTAVFGSSRPVH